MVYITKLKHATYLIRFVGFRVPPLHLLTGNDYEFTQISPRDISSQRTSSGDMYVLSIIFMYDEPYPFLIRQEASLS